MAKRCWGVSRRAAGVSQLPWLPVLQRQAAEPGCSACCSLQTPLIRQHVM